MAEWVINIFKPDWGVGELTSEDDAHRSFRFGGDTERTFRKDAPAKALLYFSDRAPAEQALAEALSTSPAERMDLRSKWAEEMIDDDKRETAARQAAATKNAPPAAHYVNLRQPQAGPAPLLGDRKLDVEDSCSVEKAALPGLAGIGRISDSFILNGNNRDGLNGYGIHGSAEQLSQNDAWSEAVLLNVAHVVLAGGYTTGFPQAKGDASQLRELGQHLGVLWLSLHRDEDGNLPTVEPAQLYKLITRDEYEKLVGMLFGEEPLPP